MLVAYSFGQVMWTMFVFFAWILFFWLLFTVFGDLFSRHDIGGGAKALWTIFVIILPFLGIFIYLIVNGRGMGERSLAKAQAQQAQMDSYVRRRRSPPPEEPSRLRGDRGVRSPRGLRRAARRSHPRARRR